MISKPIIGITLRVSGLWLCILTFCGLIHILFKSFWYHRLNRLSFVICFCICERTCDVIPNTLFPFLIITQNFVPNALYGLKIALISISDFVITFLLNRKELPEIRTYHCQKNNKTILNLLPYRKTRLKSLYWIWSIKHT